MNDTVRITATDLVREDHARAWLDLLDHYARDPMGGGSALSAFAREHLRERLIERVGFVSFMALRGERALGLINCFEGFSTFAARPLLNIHDLAVRCEERGHGIGQRLLAAAEAAARQRDCAKLTLEVLSNNRRALGAYRRFGFSPYQLDPAAGDGRFLEKTL